MKIEQLKLENFKCFKTEKTFDFEKITLLTGANNSGKSTVMQALLSAIQSDGFPLNYSPNGKYVNLGDFKEISHNGNKNSIKLSIKTSAKSIVSGNKQLEIQAALREDKRNFLPILKNTVIASLHALHDTDTWYRHTILIEEDAQTGLYNIKIQCPDVASAAYYYSKLKENTNIRRSLEKLDDLAFEPKWIGKDITFEMTLKALLFYQRQFPILPPYSLKLQDMCVKYMGAFRQPPQLSYWETNNYIFEINANGEGYIDQIVEWEKRADDKMIELATTLQSLDLLEGVKMNRLNGGKFEVLVKPLQKDWTTLANVGYGISQLLPILVSDLLEPNRLFEGNESTFFLAEPETHLHPSVQANFAQYIVNQVNTKKEKNYVIETHSEYFLNRIRLAIVKGELEASDIRVYFLESIKNDTNVYNINFTKTGEIHGAPATFFETYSMDAMQIFTNAFKE
jgi:predicted ATPase